MIQWHWSPAVDAAWHTDRGLAYGDGLFETIAVTDRGPVLPDRHRDRLIAGCHFLRLPFTATDWNCWWTELAQRGWLQAENPSGHVIKLIITRASGGRGYSPPDRPGLRAICIRSAMPQVPQAAVRLQLGNTPVSPCQSGLGLKTLNRLDQVLAAAELTGSCFDVLMTDQQGRPVEGSRTNLFVLQGGELQTPPVRDLAVAGVMRGALLTWAAQLGLKAVERSLTWAMLRRCDAAFITNSLIGALPVQRIGCLSLSTDNRIADIRFFVRQELGV